MARGISGRAFAELDSTLGAPTFLLTGTATFAATAVAAAETSGDLAVISNLGFRYRVLEIDAAITAVTNPAHSATAPTLQLYSGSSSGTSITTSALSLSSAIVGGFVNARHAGMKAGTYVDVESNQPVIAKMVIAESGNLEVGDSWSIKVHLLCVRV